MKTLPKFFLILLTAGSLFLACNKKTDDPKKDSTNPVITLKGDADMTVSLNSNSADPGATANDETDGDLSASITSDWNTTVNQSETGNYSVNYSVSDKAGNKGSATRKVTVKSTSGNLVGQYKTTLTTPNGTGPVTNSTITANGAGQITIYPVYIGYYVHATLKGVFNEEFTFDHDDQGAHLKGTGTISNGGKNISITGAVIYNNTSYPFTESLWRD